MPGFIIHMLHGKFILKRMYLNYDEKKINQFMMGILMPDSNKGYKKATSHFISSNSVNSILQVPDLELFVSKYNQYLTDPFVFGYFSHLWLDKSFFEVFFQNYVQFQDKNGYITLESDKIVQVYLIRQNKYISVSQLFSEEYLYGDYTKLNALFIRKYNLKIPVKHEFEIPVKEVDLKNFSGISVALEEYFSLPSINAPLYIFDEEELETFISGQADRLIEYYKNKEVFHIE